MLGQVPSECTKKSRSRLKSFQVRGTYALQVGTGVIPTLKDLA
jgi:hypothetical protein